MTKATFKTRFAGFRREQGRLSFPVGRILLRWLTPSPQKDEKTLMKLGKTIVLDDLGVVPHKPNTPYPQVLAEYFATLLGAAAGIYHEIPSLLSLAGFYRCGNLVIYDMLRAMRDLGYEYRLRGIDNPVEVWWTKR